MKVTVRTSGFADLDRTLSQMSKGMARGALSRAGVRAMAPMAVLAASLAPEETGELAGSIVVSAKAKGAGAAVGKAAFAAAMKGGLGKAAAVSALRDARRGANGGDGPPSVELFMGPTQAGSKKNAIKRIVQEFGSVNQPGQPYMRPAWDQDRGAMLERLKVTLWDEVQKTVARAAVRAAAKALRAARG